MIKEREPKKPKVMWDGRTAITAITAEEKREIQQHIRERREKPTPKILCSGPD